MINVASARGRRKIREGIVLSNKMKKTVTVSLERVERHPNFDKVIFRKKKIYAHVDQLDLQIGQKVKVVETRPISKLKRWLVLEVVA